MAYRKFIYWLEEADARRLTPALKKAGRDVFVVKKAVCIPLSERVEIGIVPPSAWRDYPLCRRQFSWQRQSPLADKTLLVSSEILDLEETPGLAPEVVVSERPDFQPPRRPTPKEIEALAQAPAFLTAKPQAWEDLSGLSGEAFRNWLKAMGLEGVSAEDLLARHSANHANFIEPAFFVEDGGRTPYSLGATSEVCSSCLEFYNVLGRDHETKMVVPCPGAVLFARLTPDAYYQVRRWSGAGTNGAAPI